MPTMNVLNQLVVKKDGVRTVYRIGDLIEGYYDATTGKFYVESTHTTEIEGASGFIYVDLGGNSTYIYKESTSSFVNVAGAGADNIKFGYLNPSDGKFYEDDQYTIEITADANKIYIELAHDTIYRYDTTDTEYVSIGGGGGNYTAGFGINIDTNDEISTTDFVGTQAAWDALPAADKVKYDFIHITDDTSQITYKPGHSISDGTTEKTQRDGLVFEGFEVTDDSTNEVTKIAEIPYTAGDGIDITNKEIAVGDEIAREWTGTQAQWDAIVDKSVYDGWTINITDDQTSGIGVVVDTVANGNMNAVTSNAVADAIANSSSVPDATNGIDISLTGANTLINYTAPSNGLIIIEGRTSSSTGRINIYDTSVPQYQVQVMFTNADNTSAALLVTKGREYGIYVGTTGTWTPYAAKFFPMH